MAPGSRHLLNSVPHTNTHTPAPEVEEVHVLSLLQCLQSCAEEDDHPEWVRDTSQGVFPGRRQEEQPEVGPVAAGDQDGHGQFDQQSEEGLR